MASSRALARLVSVTASISSGAVRTLLGQTETTRSGLSIIGPIFELLARTITPHSSPDPKSIDQIAAMLYRLTLRYGTVQRALDALASSRRRHPLIAADKANSWSQAMAVTANAAPLILQRHSWLLHEIEKWMTDQGPLLEKRLDEYSAWLEGPLPGSDAEEFPIFAAAAAASGGGGVSGGGGAAPRQHTAPTPNGAQSAPSPPSPPEQVSVRVESPGSDGLRPLPKSGEHEEEIALLRAMLVETKRPFGNPRDYRPTPQQRGAIEALRSAPHVLGRVLAAIADGRVEEADELLLRLVGSAPKVLLQMLRAEAHYARGRFEQSASMFRTVFEIEQSYINQANLAMALLHLDPTQHEDAREEGAALLEDIAQRAQDATPEKARAMLTFATALLAQSHDERGEYHARAIGLLDDAGAAFAALGDTVTEAEAHYHLGNAWLESPGIPPSRRCEKAIEHLDRALSLLNRDETPEHWASVQTALGRAWEHWQARDRHATVQRAIECYTSALTVRSRDNDPLHWARLQNNLGNAWIHYPVGDHAQNIERAIACHQAALEVWSDTHRRAEWAATQNNLGNAYALMPAEGEERDRNLRRAIACYKSALEVRTRGASPHEWASTQNNLGSALLTLGAGRDAGVVREAIECFRHALEVRTRAQYPDEWAKTQANLGHAWLRMPGDRRESLSEAVAYFECALEVLTPDDYPAQHRHVATRLKEAKGLLDGFGG
ncbi:MAG: hypothetical protein EA380_08080 [Phycisphaeraceae bacterium]|nr:MAG: hypothetical protein EA380_08080 [Phycisphaeraceae bacterium]